METLRRNRLQLPARLVLLVAGACASVSWASVAGAVDSSTTTTTNPPPPVTTPLSEIDAGGIVQTVDLQNVDGSVGASTTVNAPGIGSYLRYTFRPNTATRVCDAPIDANTGLEGPCNVNVRLVVDGATTVIVTENCSEGGGTFSCSPGVGISPIGYLPLSAGNHDVQIQETSTAGIPTLGFSEVLLEVLGPTNASPAPSLSELQLPVAFGLLGLLLLYSAQRIVMMRLARGRRSRVPSA